MIEARFWHTLEERQVQCDLCPRACRIAEGRRGACFGRLNRDGKLLLPEYGRVVGLAVDPIEKKPLYHFLPGSDVLSFGTVGCNMKCSFCQNWSMSHCRDSTGRLVRSDPRDIVATAKNRDCASVAFTYNEPTVFLEYAIETARACAAEGIRTVAVTNGWISPRARHEFYEVVDAVNVDLKAFTDRFYNDLCGAGLGEVLETIAYIHSETSAWLELTTLLIPEENDSSEEIAGLCEWIVSNIGCSVPLHFTAFHPDWRMMDKPATPLSSLRRARDIALACGIRYVYLGNVHDPEAASTHCHQCGEAVVVRDGYCMRELKLNAEFKCESCGARCAGLLF